MLPASLLRFPLLLLPVLALIAPSRSQAEPITVAFTAQIGTANSLDTEDVFGEGYGANLAGQIIAGSITIDPAPLRQLCAGGGACYADNGAGAISVSFTLNGVTETVVSTGTIGYFGGRSGGSVQINDPSDGGDAYLAVGATSPDGMVQESIGALFTDATLFNAYGNGDPAAAIASLDSIGLGGGLIEGGITYMNPVEHLDATILSIDVPEPPAVSLFGVTLLLLAAARRWLPCRTSVSRKAVCW